MGNYTYEEIYRFLIDNFDDLFIHNEYLVKYCKLVSSEGCSTSLKYKTQQHHIVPRFYFKYHKDKSYLKEKDINKVNLLYKNHCLAHYYLCFCVKDANLEYASYHSIEFILGNRNYIKQEFYNQEKEFIYSLDEFQVIYEKSAKMKSERYKNMNMFKGRKISDLQKQQISQKNKGLIYIHKEGVEKAKKIHPEELQEWLDKGWIKGNFSFSEKYPEGVAKMKETKKNNPYTGRTGKMYVFTSEGKKKEIFKYELDEYLSKGYFRHYKDINKG